MKQVLKDVEHNWVDSNRLDNMKYYGFCLFGDSFGQIVGNDVLSSDNTYQARLFKESTIGNPCCGKYSILQDCIENILDFGLNSEVFEFDTYQELFQWAIDTDLRNKQ
jgi:hypothetical protein